MNPDMHTIQRVGGGVNYAHHPLAYVGESGAGFGQRDAKRRQRAQPEGIKLERATI